MIIDKILEIGIDDKGRLFIKPDKERFTLIYRTSTEAHWDNNGLFLFSPKLREWTYFDWFRHLTGIAEIANHDFVKKIRDGHILNAFDAEKVLRPLADLKDFELV